MRKTALVTGASSGIGKEFATQLAALNYDLVVVARRENLLLELQRELSNVRVVVFPKDLTADNAVEDLIKFLAEARIQIDVLINNAGFGDYNRFYEADIAKLQHMIDLNVKVLTDLMYYFGKQMLYRTSGFILNVASTAAFQPGPMMATYFATKHYVLALSEAVACEWKDTGVSVTALCPGPTLSEFFDHADMTGTKLMKSVKLPTSEEVAKFGLDRLFNKKTVAVHGGLNKLLIGLTKFVPRNIVTQMTARALKS